MTELVLYLIEAVTHCMYGNFGALPPSVSQRVTRLVLFEKAAGTTTVVTTDTA